MIGLPHKSPTARRFREGTLKAVQVVRHHADQAQRPAHANVPLARAHAVRCLWSRA